MSQMRHAPTPERTISTIQPSKGGIANALAEPVNSNASVAASRPRRRARRLWTVRAVSRTDATGSE
ncbi:hypothetical protein [Corynebacterium belfantii]|uniref:hypothetical protein n=1 Tax=Corynebacterium belfantii TaxID=2014537 RepID=UPI0035A91FE7